MILAIHYPILNRRGELYDDHHHGLINASALVACLKDAPIRPLAILHGHQHHGYTVPLPLGDDEVPIYNCGSSGYAYQPHRMRAAAMNLYELEDGHLEVQRYIYDGDRFSPEPGGAYATGR